MNEIWKPVKGYEGYYEVSNLGRIKSIERMVKWKGRERFVKETIKATNIDKGGYPVVTLCRDCKSTSVKVHRIIAEAFIPNPDNKPLIDHINTIRTDNRVENLRWCTNQENCNNPITLRNARKNNYTKESCAKANETKRKRKTMTAPKFVCQYTKQGLLLNVHESIQDAMRNTGIHASAISCVCSGKRFSAGGYIWKFKNET